jgi:hypothetical protein
MADGANIGGKPAPQAKPAQLTSLAAYRYVADGETVASVQYIYGIIQLIFGAIELDEAASRLPHGVMEGLGAINHLATRVLTNAGAA